MDSLSYFQVNKIFKKLNFFSLEVKYWINKNIEKSKENGYSTTFFGNKHNFNWEKDKEKISSQNALERRCVNFVIQASVFKNYF